MRMTDRYLAANKILYTLLVILVGCHSNNPSPPSTPSRCHGQDILGLARQDVEMIATNWEKGECLGVLDGTFGPAIPAVKVVVERSTVPAVRWHLSFCNHGNQCQVGECPETDINCMANRAKLINDFHSNHKNTKCYISPRVEYASKNCTLVNSWFNAVKTAAPKCTLVASFMPGACVPANVLIEKHGNIPGIADIVSNDGSNIFDADSRNYVNQGTLINFKWTPRNNLRLTSEKGTPLPPMQRPLTNRLEVKDLKHMQFIKLPVPPQPPAPATCSGLKTFQGRDLLKTHSEDYGAGNDARGNKPLLISKNPKNTTLDIYKSNGERVSCAKYYGPYIDAGYNRHYVGSCSGDTAVDLYNKVGAWAFINENNLCRAITPLHRMGYFR